MALLELPQVALNNRRELPAVTTPPPTAASRRPGHADFELGLVEFGVLARPTAERVAEAVDGDTVLVEPGPRSTTATRRSLTWRRSTGACRGDARLVLPRPLRNA